LTFICKEPHHTYSPQRFYYLLLSQFLLVNVVCYKILTDLLVTFILQCVFWEMMRSAVLVLGTDEHAHTKPKSAFENLDLKEKSTMTYLFGPVHLIISSHMVDCMNKFVACAQNHDYEPYSKPKTGNIILQYNNLNLITKLGEHDPLQGCAKFHSHMQKWFKKCWVIAILNFVCLHNLIEISQMHSPL